MRPLTCLIAAGMLAVATPPALAQTVAYGEAFDTLYRVDLDTRVATRVGESGRYAGQVIGNISGLTTTPDGAMHAVAGGLTFIGATPDGYFRAFDTATGAELWRAKLPAGARSTPMTYEGADGRQYVVIAAGGDGELWGQGDEFVAFAVPSR